MPGFPEDVYFAQEVRVAAGDDTERVDMREVTVNTSLLLHPRPEHLPKPVLFCRHADHRTSSDVILLRILRFLFTLLLDRTILSGVHIQRIHRRIAFGSLLTYLPEYATKRRAAKVDTKLLVTSEKVPLAGNPRDSDRIPIGTDEELEWDEDVDAFVKDGCSRAVYGLLVSSTGYLTHFRDFHQVQQIRLIAGRCGQAIPMDFFGYREEMAGYLCPDVWLGDECAGLCLCLHAHCTERFVLYEVAYMRGDRGKYVEEAQGNHRRRSNMISLSISSKKPSLNAYRRVLNEGVLWVPRRHAANDQTCRR